MISKENTIRKIDTMGRVSIPKSLRDRFRLGNGDEVEFFVIADEGGKYIGFKKVGVNGGEKDKEKEIARKVLEEMGLEVPEGLK